MADFVTALIAAVTPTALWGALAPLAPLIGTLIVFALSVYFVRKMVGGAGKGKAKL